MNISLRKSLTLFIIVWTVLSSCGNKETGHNLPCDLPDEIGLWVSVSDTSYESPYYLIGDSIYVGYISLSNESPREFFLRKRSNSFLVNPLTDVDIASFEVNINKDRCFYARDKNAVYYPCGKANGGGPEFFDGIYGGGELYFGDISIDEADPQTFQYIGSNYASDKYNIYFKGYVVQQADHKTFKVLGKGYAIDKDNMYYQGRIIKWNDHIIDALNQPDCPNYLPIDYGMTEDKF